MHQTMSPAGGVYMAWPGPELTDEASATNYNPTCSERLFPKSQLVSRATT
jgi:hypothetical protein